MSLSDQLWSPTSVQVTVLQARGLRIKGKSGTNDAYAVMQVGKEKYQTSVAEKCVAPMWKEEASFDLPLAHQGGTERGTLHVHVLHRALVGPDKLLGQAVINLLQLCEDKTRDKTQWFKLLDKAGKPDKDRGEVLVDIQFTRNNMTASMFDISAAGKSRSRLGKFKDKVRGKKKDGLSETESNVVPSVTQVLTDSEGNSDGEEAVGKDEEKKKKKKVKSLFSHKSNLQKSLSQSMNVLPGKNSSLSGSLSSGLNVESSEGKKKFKFMMHKRTGSSDKKDGQQKLAPEQSNLCINGSHVYCDEPPPRTSRTGSSFSLASSGVGSMEDVPESSPPSVGSNRSVRHHSPWTEEEGATGEDAKQEVDEEGELFRRQELEKLAEEESRKEEEQRRIEQEKHEEQLKIEKEEEERKLQEEQREKEEEERRQAEEVRIEQERLKKEEENKQAAEKTRLEEERKREESEQRELEKRKKEEEEMRRMKEEEQQRREELEKLEKERMRIEKEEQKRGEEEEKKQKAEEEERAREKKRFEQEVKAKKEIQERQLEEERRQKELMEEQARIRKEEEERFRMEMERAEEEQRIEKERQLEEERKRLEEEEKKRIEEEKRRREREEEMQQEEEERVRREKEEEKRLMEEERRREQLKEEQERIRKEEKMRLEKQRAEEEQRKKREEERVIKEREEYERQLEEKRKQKEEEERMGEEEKRKREEALQMAEEKRRQEAEEKRRQEEERKRRIEVEERVVTVKALRRNKTTLETQDSTNPFDEEDAPERNTSVRLRCKLPLESNTCSYSEKDLSTTHQEKRQAPKPPRMNSSERRREAQHEAKVNEPSKDKEVKTASVLPQRGVLRISPTSASCVHPKSNEQPEHIPNTARAHNQGKRPAPQRPGSVEEEQLTTKGKISHLPVPETQQTPGVYGLNPFEDEDTDEPTAEDTTTTTATPTSVQQITPKDTVSQIKIKSSKAAQAPVPPAKKPHTSSPSVKQSPDGGPSVSLSDTAAPVQETSHEEPPSVKEEAVKKDAPLVPSRRLQPVRPLNPLDQQPVSAVQGETDNKSTGGILNGQGKAKASGTGPYALLTQEELISLVLKQESQLSEKNQKISELEQYIDNLLVRVIDEAPGILMTLASVK